MTDLFETPVLLIAFNRVDTAQRVFERIRAVRPSELYIAVDGARMDHPGEKEKCMECQALVDKVDWPCNVHTRFSEKNCGCGFGPANAISWAFETANRLIVLEDDCYPSVSFFRFCQEMLIKYEEDSRIGIVSGLSIHHGSPFFGEYDYIFSKLAHTWGWATWKNRWEQFDMYMSDFPTYSQSGGTLNYFYDKKIGERVNKNFRRAYQRIDDEVKHSWDTQWSYARKKNSCFDIIPRCNLIKNIGDMDGTHTVGSSSIAMGIPNEELDFPLKHPDFVAPSYEYDMYHYSHYIYVSKWRVLLGLIRRGEFRTILRIILRKVS